jgi:peptidyl-prolyl cis-trans isomerase SurA
MKKFYLLFIFVAGACAAHTQTLITYGNNTVSVDEFLRAYNKNKTPVTDKEKSLREYVDLYTNFKLKVQAASELRLDTLPQITADIENFRGQVEENYMSDEKGRDALLAEAVDRSFKDLHIVHFSIPVDANATPADSLKAYQFIYNAYNELQKGNTNFNALASKYTPLRYSDVGFVTVFSLPYQFENIIYGLKPGEVSKPYRTKNAWHVFKLVEERPSTGKWKVAQILFSIPAGASDEDKAIIKNRADSVYSLLVNGAEFSGMVKKYSEDKLTYMTGGELPEFSTGKFDYAFEKEVLQLKADGDISKPFLTPFGYHIVKRLGHTPVSTDRNDPSTQFEFKQKILKDSRIDASKQKFSKEIAAKIGFKQTNAVKEADLLRYADSVMKNPVVENTLRFPISNKEIIRYTKGPANKGADWLRFVIEYKGNFNEYKGETNKELWDKYLTYAAHAYYKAHMENYNEDFRYQMKEFKEGNMLFEIMERNVWGLANSDSTGLKNYYATNKTKYTWPASADVLIFNCTNEKSAGDAFESMKKGKDWKDIADAHGSSVQVDSGRYELSQLIGADGNMPVANTYSPILKNQDGTAVFIKYLQAYPAGPQRSFEEAKGLVINDYQNVLEEKWLAQLRKKYPVKVNETALQRLIKP